MKITRRGAVFLVAGALALARPDPNVSEIAINATDYNVVTITAAP